MLSFKEIKDLIDLVAERGLAGLEIEQAGFRVRIEGHRAAPAAAAGLNPVAEVGPLPAALAPAAASAALPATPAPPEPDENLHLITSPIVGTFYRAPSPEAESFAEVGQRVARGKILCIIESMKLMNEIESEVAGLIESKLVQNGQPVEYGEALFAIRPV